MRQFIFTFFLAALFLNLSAGTIEHTYNFDKYQINQSGEYSTFSIENLFLTGKHGEPVLPYQAVKLLLPPGMIASDVEFIGENEVIVPGIFQLYPQQPSRPLSEHGNSEFLKNNTIYSTDTPYPNQQTGTLTTQYLNGYAIALCTFTPVTYNPVSGTVSYFQKVTIRVHTKAAQQSSVANLTSSKKATKRVQDFVQNPAIMELYPAGSKDSEDYQMLVITPQQFVSAFENYLDIYTTRGIKTQIVTKETINSTGTGQDLQEKIRNFIIQEYQDFNIEYVLLGGDVEHIPYRGFYCYAQSGSGYEDYDIPADLYYAGLDGIWNDNGDNKWGEPGEDDLLPEIGIGRFSFSNATELNNMINKSVSYQNNPVLGEFRDALMAGEWLYSSPETWGSDYLELLIGYQNENGYETYGIPDDYNFQKLYEETTPWGANTLITSINSGKQYVHHVGHANSNYVAYMSNSDITNANFFGANGIDHNFTIFHSHGCICGAFDDSDCIMEKMHSIENFAVAVVGNSRYGWFNEGQTEGPAAHLHREMMDALYHENMYFIGEAFKESKIQTAPWVTAPGQWEEGALRWNFYDINILGDPAMAIWTNEPMEIDVTHSGVYAMGTNLYEVTVSSNGNPAENLRCAFLCDNELYGVGYTDASGFVEINIEGLENPGDAQLVVSGNNCLPEAFDVVCSVNTGIVETNKSRMNIFPNPVTDHFTIEYNLPSSSGVSIKIIDQVGKTFIELANNEVQSAGFHSLDFTKPNLADGLYMMQIKTDSQTIVQKFIISK